MFARSQQSYNFFFFYTFMLAFAEKIEDLTNFYQMLLHKG